jgi:hypothetical protein
MADLSGQFDNRISGGSDQWDNGLAGQIRLQDYFRPSSTASGVTLTLTASLVAGSAFTGEALDGNASGANLTTTSSLTAGSASAAATTVNYGIANTADDAVYAYEYLDNTYLFFGAYDSSQAAGVHFSGVAVPQAATITSATLTVKRDDANTQAGSNYGVVKGVASDNAPAWTTTNPLAASKTTESVTVTNNATVAYDVAAIVQVIVNRAGWASGNAMAFVSDATGANGAVGVIDYVNSSTDAAQLSITYTSGGPASYTIDGAATGTGTATGETAPGPRPITGDAIGTGLATGDFVSALRTKKAYRVTPRFRGGYDVWYDTASIVAGPEFWDAAPSGGTSYTIDGAASGLGAATGLILRTAPVSSVAAGLAVATGLAGRSAPIVGTATGTGTATGDVGTQGGADGSATGAGTATGSVGVSKPIASAASGTGTATGAVLRLATINGVAVGTGAATGAVGRLATVTGAASGTGTSSGETGYASAPAFTGATLLLDRRRRRSAVR